MDEDNGQFVPLTEERHSPASQVDPADQDGTSNHGNSRQQEVRVSPLPFDHYSDKENSESIRTVMRRDGSPALSSERKRMIEYVPGDNDELFTPAKTLNFTDADETETDIERSVDHGMSFMKSDEGELNVDANGMRNQRIIEGHDSSPMDHPVSVRVSQGQGQSSPVAMVTMSPGSNHLRKLSVESQDISPNLYDSLDEKEDIVYQSTNQHQAKYDMQQNKTDLFQKPDSIFSPLQSPHHQMQRQKESPINYLQGSSIMANRDFIHSSPHSEPLPSLFSEKTALQHQTMSQSLPETTHRGNYEEFRNNLGKKTETVPVSTSESEWYTPSVSGVIAEPAKAPVDHIALNIQRVKNASKANKGGPQAHQSGQCPRLGRIDSKQSNRNQAQNRSNGNGHTRPTGKSTDHPRPVVQGSSGHDSQSVSANQSQGQGNVPGPAERGLRQFQQTSSRYGGVGGEVRRDGGHLPVMTSSPGSGVRGHYSALEQQSATESQSLPSSYVQHPGHHGYLPRNSPPLHDCEAVTKQMSQIRSPRGNQLSPGQTRGDRDLYVDLQGMDGVRSHLQSMLRLSNDVIQAEASKFDHSDTASELLMDQPLLTHHLKLDSSSLIGSRVQEEVSELVENFPNLSSKIFSDMSSVAVGRQESAVLTENQYLRDVMEKERYRRKHCEQHIQQLNSKLLETQQQLAVAVSTDKRKDIMIEQLDKQLAKVVEGWKKREREKDDYLNLLVKEKKQIEETLNRQQAMMNNFERDFSDTVAELKREKENSAVAIEDLRREVEKKTREKVQAEEVLAGEQERVGLVLQEWEQLKQSRQLAEDRAQHLQDKLHKEQDDWYRREQELVGRIDDVKEANLKVIQMERLKGEERERRVEELEEKKHSLDTDNKRLELELDEAQREKESLKVEMAILEAKFESSQRKMEADLHSQMEKEISEQVGEVHQKMETIQDELQEKHRQHVAEIHARHQRDTERQIAQFHDDTRRSEENYRQTIQDLEERLTEYRNENATLKHAKQKLESQRMEILTKMQYMMQSQWNEAVSLLVSSPHKKQTVNGSVVSGIPPPSTNLNLSIVSSGQPKTSSPNSRSEEQRGSSVSERETRVPRDAPHTDQVEQYVNSFPTSSHNPSQEESQGFLVSKHTEVDNSFSSENSGPQIQRPPEFDPTDQGHGQGMTFPDLHLDQSLLSHLNSSVIPRHIHGYLVNQGSSLPSNQNVNLQALANQNHAFYSLVNQPGAAVMLRPPQQQTHFYNQGQGAFLQDRDVGQGHMRQGQVPHSPSKQRSQRRTHRREQHRTTEYEDSDEDMHPPAPVYNQPGMSPPVKQSRNTQEEEGFNPRLSHRDLATPDQLAHALEDTVRLTADYSHISERVAEHESRQNELQHYIKMLLDRPPGSSPVQPVHDIPITSDLETSRDITGEIDLNDTAQAAQLNRELQRLQQLREQVSQRDGVPGVRDQPEKDTARTQRPAPPGVLEPAQLEEISRLLDVYRQQGETTQRFEDQAVNQLLSLLQQLPPSTAPKPSSEVREGDGGVKTSPRGPRQKVRTTGQKKAPPVTMRPGPAKNLLDTSLAKSDSSQSGKNQPQKKVERKLAGNQANKQQNKSKLSAWK